MCFGGNPGICFGRSLKLLGTAASFLLFFTGTPAVPVAVGVDAPPGVSPPPPLFADADAALSGLERLPPLVFKRSSEGSPSSPEESEGRNVGAGGRAEGGRRGSVAVARTE